MGPGLTQGFFGYRDYDLGSTNCLVCWGTDPLASNRMVPNMMNQFPGIVKRGTVIAVDPRLSNVAAKAHEWLPILPGTDGALAGAIAHVLLTEGRVDEGLGFMQQASSSWTGLNSFMQTHNWWHLALFLLEDGRADEALQLHDSQVWGVVPAYSQDQIGSISLLARLELEGVDVGQRWQQLAPYLLARQHDHVLPFLDLQYLYGLARAGEWEAAQSLLASMQNHAEQLTQPQLRTIWRQVCLPAAQGLLAYAQGLYQAAADLLG